jgi:hypothetical protein
VTYGLGTSDLEVVKLWGVREATGMTGRCGALSLERVFWEAALDRRPRPGPRAATRPARLAASWLRLPSPGSASSATEGRSADGGPVRLDTTRTRGPFQPASVTAGRSPSS